MKNYVPIVEIRHELLVLLGVPVLVEHHRDLAGVARRLHPDSGRVGVHLIVGGVEEPDDGHVDGRVHGEPAGVRHRLAVVRAAEEDGDDVVQDLRVGGGCCLRARVGIVNDAHAAAVALHAVADATAHAAVDEDADGAGRVLEHLQVHVAPPVLPAQHSTVVSFRKI